MKNLLSLITCLSLIPIFAFSQNADSQAIKRVGFNYIEGFYEGDTVKLVKALSPSLDKYGYYKNKGEYQGSAMSFQAAKDYANNVKENKNFPSPDSPKKVEILDQQDFIAAIKVTAWWGVDYMLLSKKSGQWQIEKVLWQGPIETVRDDNE